MDKKLYDYEYEEEYNQYLDKLTTDYWEMRERMEKEIEEREENKEDK